MTAEPLAPTVRFAYEPAIRHEDDGRGGVVELADLSRTHLCAMRHTAEHEAVVGWREHEDADGRIRLEWHPYYEIRLTGDAEPTRVCEDDAGLIGVLSDALRDYDRHVPAQEN